MSLIVRHASRSPMNGAGLVVDVVVRNWRTFHTNTKPMAFKFQTIIEAVKTMSSVNTHTSEGISRYNSSTTDHWTGGSDSSGSKKPFNPSGIVTAPNAPTTMLCPKDRKGEDSVVISVRKNILSNTVLSRQHMTPEIALHLITPDCAIYHQPVGADHYGDGGVTDTGFAGDPFWGFFWPGGQALTRFILDTGHVFRNKSVLEVGCGCGASAIAALMVGARQVIANDIDPVALQATLLNAERNGIIKGDSQLVVSSDHLISHVADNDHRCEVVLIGDLFYDTEIAAELYPWIQRLARTGAEIFIGDPGRHGISETGILSHMELRARYELLPNVCLENSGFSHANVWQFRLNEDEPRTR